MTDPLTPPECDLRGLPFMPLDVVRLTDSDLFALATGDEFKAAVALWCKSWLQVPAGSLPDDDRILAHISGGGPRWKKVKDMALRGFVLCSDGRWYHPLICEKAREAWRHRLQQRERAAKRWDREKMSPGNATASPAAHATASPTAMQGRGRGTVIPLDKSSGGGANRATRLSKDFKVPPEWLDWGKSERGWADEDVRAEAASFVDYWRAKPGRDGTKLDWQATWRNWVRNSHRQARPRQKFQL